MNCSHPQCLCQAGSVIREGSMYCSPACANLGATPAGEPMSTCPCGHDDCALAASAGV